MLKFLATGLALSIAAAAAPVAAAQTGGPSNAEARAMLGAIGRIATPDGIDVSQAVEIGGIKQCITVRGKDRRNPILLLVHGGPAAPDMPLRWLFEGPWTDYFTVVEWDQRGAGKTMAINDPAAIAPTLTEDRIVADAEELVTYLRRTYGKDKIFVMGHSWGSLIGMRLAQQIPDQLYAYIGVGQIIDMRRSEKLSYDWVLAEAKRDHNAKAIAELEAIAPYPEADGVLPLDKINIERKWSVHYGGLSYGHDSYAYLSDAQALSPDYSAADVAAIDAGSALSLPRLLPAMARADFMAVDHLDCPVILFEGRHDYTTVSTVADGWFRRLQAPDKHFVWFENSAHMMFEEEPGKVLVSLVRYALPLAEGAAPERR
jgi:pimeloyl-ACP methyl ester carboxylesterase